MSDYIMRSQLEHVTEAVTYLMSAPGAHNETDNEGGNRRLKLLDNLTFNNAAQTFAQTINNAWLSYRVPMYTSTEAQALYQQYLEVLAAAGKAPSNPPEMAQIVYKHGGSEHYKSIRMIPGSVTYDKANPCEYEPEIKYENFAKCVVYDENAKAYDLNDSLINFLQLAQSYGLNREQLAEWLKMFAVKVAPLRRGHIESLNEPIKVWRFMVGLINYPVYVKKLEKVLMNMVRYIDEPFSDAINKFIDVKIKLDSIMRPAATESERRKQAEGDAKKIMYSFMLPVTKGKLKEFCKLYSRTYEKSATFKQRLAHVDQIELDENLTPKEVLTVNKQGVELSVYLAQSGATSLESDYSSSEDEDFGPEVYATGSSKAIGMTSAQLSPNQKWTARSDLQRSDGDSQVGGYGAAGQSGDRMSRRDDNRLTSKKKKLLVRSKSGNSFRELSADRVERPSAPKGNKRPFFKNRNDRSTEKGRTPSRDRSSDTGNGKVICTICDGDCDGRYCAYYDTATPAAVVCPKCKKGRHSSEKCLAYLYPQGMPNREQRAKILTGQMAGVSKGDKFNPNL